jgi:hypothetical protein
LPEDNFVVKPFLRLGGPEQLAVFIANKCEVDGFTSDSSSNSIFRAAFSSDEENHFNTDDEEKCDCVESLLAHAWEDPGTEDHARQSKHGTSIKVAQSSRFGSDACSVDREPVLSANDSNDIVRNENREEDVVTEQVSPDKQVDSPDIAKAPRLSTYSSHSDSDDSFVWNYDSPSDDRDISSVGCTSHQLHGNFTENPDNVLCVALGSYRMQ